MGSKSVNFRALVLFKPSTNDSQCKYDTCSSYINFCTILALYNICTVCMGLELGSEAR